MHYTQGAEESSDTQRFSRTFKVAVALIGGAGLVLLSVVLIPNLQSTNADSTDLVGMMPMSLRASPMPMRVPPAIAKLPGEGPWKELTLLAIESANRCDRDVSANAQIRGRFNSIVSNMDKKDRDVMVRAVKKVQETAGGLADAPYGLEAGMVGPVKGLWDPFKLSADVTEGELLFFREAEITHGRVCMLATLGFYVQEKFHPLFGGDIDIPAIQSAGQLKLAIFWPIAFFVLGIPEFFRLSRIDYATESLGFIPELMAGEEPGNIGFDPLGLRPSDPEEYLKRQNQELLHGRLAMISAAGMIAQEVLTQSKLNEGGIYGDVPFGGR